jgi:protein SCO1/2
MVALAILVFFVAITRPRGRGVFADSFDLKPVIGAQMPITTKLTNEKGETKTLGEYLQVGRPVMLLPIFYKCNGVCYAELDSLTKVLIKEVAVSTKKTVDSVVPGRDFDLVVVSIHPKETVELANAKKAEIMGIMMEGWKKLSPTEKEQAYNTVDHGIHFTIGDPADVRELTATMGFEYSYDEKRDWVNHPAAAVFLAGSGKIIGYNTGDKFATVTVRAGVKDAAKGVVEPLGDVFLLGCFKMEASSPRTRTIIQILNTSAVLTVLVLGVAMFRMFKKYPSNTLPTGGPTA